MLSVVLDGTCCQLSLIRNTQMQMNIKPFSVRGIGTAVIIFIAVRA